DEVDAVAVLVGDVEHRAVGAELDVLRLGSLTVLRRQGQQLLDALVGHVDPQQLAAELAAEQRVGAVGREVGVVDALARDSECRSAMVCGSRKSSRRSRSATTTANCSSAV